MGLILQTAYADNKNKPRRKTPDALQAAYAADNLTDPHG